MTISSEKDSFDKNYSISFTAKCRSHHTHWIIAKNPTLTFLRLYYNSSKATTYKIYFIIIYSETIFCHLKIYLFENKFEKKLVSNLSCL